MIVEASKDAESIACHFVVTPRDQLYAFHQALADYVSKPPSETLTSLALPVFLTLQARLSGMHFRLLAMVGNVSDLRVGMPGILSKAHPRKMLRRPMSRSC